MPLQSKYNIENCRATAKERGGKCLSEFYISLKSPMKWQCKNGHTWTARYSNLIYQKNWCPRCSYLIAAEKLKLSLSECKKFAIAKGGKCLSDEYKNAHTRMDWECGRGHRWAVDFTHIKHSKTWCPRCGVIDKVYSRKPILSECNDFAKSKGGLCLSKFYKNSQTPMEWQCKNGHRWEVKYGHIKHSNSWCPYCIQSKPEAECRRVFETVYNKKFNIEYPAWLINPITKRLLQLDGYCDELKIAFEYDSDYHNRTCGRTQEQLDHVKYIDGLKTKLCIENNIILVRIPSKTKLPQIEQYIKSKIPS